MIHHPEIPGLIVVDDLLDAQAQTWCVTKILNGEWNGGIEHHRRTQHYGYKYDYRARTVSRIHDYLGKMPSWLSRLAVLLNSFSGVNIPWSQAIINEYRRSVGIGEHSDSQAFGPEVATVSLGAASIMTFRPHYNAPTRVRVPLVPGGMLLMTGPSRRPWTHEINAADMPGLRWSITFRYLPER